MEYTTQWKSPIGTLTIASDGTAITGLWMEGQRYFCAGLSPEASDGTNLAVIQDTIRFLERTFLGEPDDLQRIPMAPSGTVFQKAVWSSLAQIPRGETRTYGQIAAAVEAAIGRRTAPRAVGAAVGKNPIAILIPCHRVVGANGSLTGYAGGLERKAFLLNLEQKNGTAL